MRRLAFKSRPEEEGGGKRRYVYATVVDVILFVLFINRANNNNNNKLSFVAMNSQLTKYMLIVGRSGPKFGMGTAFNLKEAKTIVAT